MSPPKKAAPRRRSASAGGRFLTDFDLHLFGEGTHTRLWEKLGAHLTTLQGKSGCHFAVWAPNAAKVSVVGSFNDWNPRMHFMKRLGTTGVWETFVPGVEQGALYKFLVMTKTDLSIAKADPYGSFMELRPNTASVVYDLDRYEWGDADWIANRATRQAPDKPISIYDVHPGSWRRPESSGEADRARQWLDWRELAEQLLPYVKALGFTHIELMPITEHPFDGSWGYQTVGYFAPTSRFGAPDDFRAFVDAAHQAGIGVILDWVPAHFPTDGHGLGQFDGTHLYEHADPRKGRHLDWGTYIYNFGRPQVCALLWNSALFWLDQYHLDGLRVDAVASMLYLDYSRKAGEWVPNRFGGRENLEAVAFLKQFNRLVHERFPGVLTFAEESTSWPGVTRPADRGGLGFDYKWNMGWMNDMLKYMRTDPLYRNAHQRNLTFSLMYAFTENFLLPLSHDEVVHGKYSLARKMPGDEWRKLANLRALLGYMFAHPGKKFLFMGGEFGQWREWSHERPLDWHLLEEARHRQLQDYVRSLGHLYASEPALHQVDTRWEGFQWIDFQDNENSVVCFIRRATDANDFVLVVANFTPMPREGYRIGVPTAGRYVELLNGDDARFGGSGVVNAAGVDSEAVPYHGQPASIVVTLPPLAVTYWKRR